MGPNFSRYTILDVDTKLANPYGRATRKGLATILTFVQILSLAHWHTGRQFLLHDLPGDPPSGWKGESRGAGLPGLPNQRDLVSGDLFPFRNNSRLRFDQHLSPPAAKGTYTWSPGTLP